MMNIKLFFVLTSVLFSVSMQAQEAVSPEIQQKVDAFIELSNQKIWDQAFDLMYPKLFLKVPKQELVDLMTSMDRDGLSLHRSNLKLRSSTVPFYEGDETYVRMEYTADLAVQVTAGSMYDADKPIMGMTQQFESSYGETNVKYDPAAKKYDIRASISMMAIKSQNQWYLVEINNDQKELMEYLFSENVLNALVRLN
jgi:hypothetical protein